MPDPAPRILLCGPSVRAFAQSATRAGYRVFAVDDFGDLDLAEVAEEVHPSPPDADGYEALFRKIRPDAWCYGGGWENKPALVERLSRIAPLWGNGAETLRVLRDPLRWSAELRAQGFEVPRTIAPEDLPRSSAGEDAAGIRWLSKRFDGANGSHVRWADELSPENEPGERRYLQEFVAGQIESASFVSVRGGLQFLGACRQIVGAEELGASGFGFAGAVGPLPLSFEEKELLMHLGDAIAVRFAPVHGLFGVDGVRTPDGRWLPIEINPRYAASMETLDAHRPIPIFARHAEACGALSRRVGLDPPAFGAMPPHGAKQESDLSPDSTGPSATSNAPHSANERPTTVGQGPPYEGKAAEGSDATRPTPRGCLAKGILYAKHELSLSFDLPAWRRFESEFHGVRLADLPRPGTISRPGDPILTLLLPGTGVNAARTALLRTAPRVYEQLERRFGRE